MQDLCMRISCAKCLRSSRTTCAGSLYADLLCKISLLGCLRQDPVVHQDLLCKISLRISAGPLVEDPFQITQTQLYHGISGDGHARSLQTVALRTQKSQLCQHFARWTRTISAEGCTSKSEIATLPASRAMDTHDLRRRLHFEIRNRNFTCIPCHRHARSLQTVALRNQKSQLCLHSVQSTRTISAEGSHVETMLQKYCACHEIMSRGHTKCCTGHAKASPSSSSKNATPLRNCVFDLKI